MHTHTYTCTHGAFLSSQATPWSRMTPLDLCPASVPRSWQQGLGGRRTRSHPLQLRAQRQVEDCPPLFIWSGSLQMSLPSINTLGSIRSHLPPSLLLLGSPHCLSQCFLFSFHLAPLPFPTSHSPSLALSGLLYSSLSYPLSSSLSLSSPSLLFCLFFSPGAPCPPRPARLLHLHPQPPSSTPPPLSSCSW